MSHLQGETYYRQMGMSDAMIAFMDTYPTLDARGLGHRRLGLGAGLDPAAPRAAAGRSTPSRSRSPGAIGNCLYTAMSLRARPRSWAA